MINQKLALQEVEQILLKLDAATALYPSTKALASQYPLYKSPQFTAKFKVITQYIFHFSIRICNTYNIINVTIV